MKAKLPTVKIVVFTTWDEDSDMASAFSVGADGFCNLENSSDLIECISSIMVGDYWIPGKANRELTMPLTA
jgi:DNA-binding NarL/FixJ family response regulator